MKIDAALFSRFHERMEGMVAGGCMLIAELSARVGKGMGSGIGDL